MKKLKAIGFAFLYLAISLVIQLVIGVVISMQLVMVRLINGSQDFDIKQWQNQMYEQLESSQFNIILVALVNLIVIAGYGLWYYFIRTRRDVSDVPYRTILSAKSVGCTFGLAVCGQFVCNIIMMVFSVVFPMTFQEYVKLAEGLDIHVLPAALMLFIVAVWSPLAEELIFRAMIFRTLRNGFSFWPAALISGMLFGAYHMNWVQGVYAAALGVILAYTYEKTNSLLGCYLLHFMFNLTSYGLEAVQKGIPEFVAGLIFLVLEAVSLVGIVLFLRWYSRIFAGGQAVRQKLREEPELQEETQEKLEN